jgi:methyltransferase
MVTRWIFFGFLGLLGLQRLLELRLSQRNEERIRRMGGVEHAPGHFKWMKFLHTSWFLAMIGEVILLKRPFRPALAGIAFLLASLGQALRYAAIQTLGPRWTVRILTLPESTLVHRGIYRYIQHPNYAGVVLEILSVPLLHSAYLTSILWSLMNGVILAIRVREEEKALRANTRYTLFPCDRPRFFPGLREKRKTIDPRER